MPSDANSLARGKYLFEKVALCSDCHEKDLGGKVVEDNFVIGRLVAPNLTRGNGGFWRNGLTIPTRISSAY